MIKSVLGFILVFPANRITDTKAWKESLARADYRELPHVIAFQSISLLIEMTKARHFEMMNTMKDGQAPSKKNAATVSGAMRISRLTIILVGLCALAGALYMSLHLAPRHDYGSFSNEWSRIVAGEDPWLVADGTSTGNAYGPLFNLFSLLYAIHPYLPRAFFALAWFAGGAILYRRVVARRHDFAISVLFVAAFLFLNPYLFLTAIYYGQFDIVVAVMCLLALLMRMRDKDKASGVFLGLAALLKIYPIVILPALVLDKWKIRREVLLGFAAVMACGYGIAFVIWGSSVFAPLTFASGRESSAFSIFYFLRGRYSPFGAVNLDGLSLPLMAASLLALTGYHIKRGLHPLVASILFFFIALTFYKVGHAQFYLPLFFLLALWVIEDGWHGGDAMMAKLFAFPPLIFISLAVFLYYLTGDFSGEWAKMQELIGLPAFVLSVISIIFLLKSARTTEAGTASGKR